MQRLLQHVLLKNSQNYVINVLEILLMEGREKLIQLGLDDKSITDKLIKIYEKLIDIKLNKHL